MKEEVKVDETNKNVTEESTSLPNGNKNKKRKIILIIEAIIAIIIIIIVTVLFIDYYQIVNNHNSNNIENEEKDTEPDLTPFETDMKVKNINTSNDYGIVLVREYDENHKENEDIYIYNFYNKLTNNKIGGIKLNGSSRNKCAKNLFEKDCIMSKTKIFSFNASGIDYIYILLGHHYFIYDTNGTLINNGYDGSDEIEVIGDEIVIESDKTTNNYERLTIDELSSYADQGYIFSKGGSFEQIMGKDAFKYNGTYVILDYSNEINPNRFKINIYNEKGLIIDTIENGIAYNKNYVLTYANSELAIYDYKHNKYGIVNFPQYDENKYGVYLNLTEEDDKIVIRIYLKDSDDSTQFIYFNLK